MNLYRLLLRLAPRRLREKHGAEMEALFREQLAQAGGRGALAIGVAWCHAILDITISIPHNLIEFVRLSLMTS